MGEIRMLLDDMLLPGKAEWCMGCSQDVESACHHHRCPMKSPTRPMDGTISVTIRLPVSGLMDDYVLALKAAAQSQLDQGNVAVCQAIRQVSLLAEAGALALRTATKPPPLGLEPMIGKVVS